MLREVYQNTIVKTTIKSVKPFLIFSLHVLSFFHLEVPIENVLKNSSMEGRITLKCFKNWECVCYGINAQESNTVVDGNKTCGQICVGPR